MEMFQYSEKKVRMGWHSPALCAVSSRLSFPVGCMLPSASTAPPAASWRVRPLGQCHHKDPWGRTPAPSLFSALPLTLLCSTILTQLLGRESLVLSPPALMLSPALPALPSAPREENHGELGICLHHQSPPGSNEESGEVELHEIWAGTVCRDADACRIAVELLRAVVVGGCPGLGVREGFIY